MLLRLVFAAPGSARAVVPRWTPAFSTKLTGAQFAIAAAVFPSSNPAALAAAGGGSGGGDPAVPGTPIGRRLRAVGMGPGAGAGKGSPRLAALLEKEAADRNAGRRPSFHGREFPDTLVTQVITRPCFRFN